MFSTNLSFKNQFHWVEEMLRGYNACCEDMKTCVQVPSTHVQAMSISSDETGRSQWLSGLPDQPKQQSPG